jgi:hypothetical protein
MTEAQIESAFVAFAQGAGLRALKLRIDGQNGWPDRTIFTWKGPVFFEFKTKTGKFSVIQKVWKTRLTNDGYSYFSPTSLEEAKAMLIEFLKGEKTEGQSYPGTGA